MHRGYVKLWRKSLESPLWKNQKVWRFFEWCLLKASYKEHTQMVGYQEVLLQPGEFIFGRKKASEDTGLSQQSIRTCINCLKSTNNLTIKSTSKYSIIQIQNWDFYQQDNQQDNQQTNKELTINQPATNQQLTTNKKDKKDKNGKKDKKVEEYIYVVFNHWNTSKTIVHKNLNEDTKRVISKTLKNYTLEEINQAITNYALIVKGEEYFWTHKWTLKEFLNRGIDKFLDLDIAKNNYRRDSEKGASCGNDGNEWRPEYY